MSIDDLPAAMSAYERQRWSALMAHWDKKARRRQILPGRAREALSDAQGRLAGAGARTVGAMGNRVPQPAKDAAAAAADQALAPTLKAAARMLELINDWVLELTDPEPVLQHHRSQGRPVAGLSDLRDLDLEHLDDYTRHLVLRWRSIGAAEGAGLGALAMLPAPVVGSAAAIGLDLLAMQVLSGALATRVCYAYGIDVQDPRMRPVVERMVARSYGEQAAKVATVGKAGKAMKDSAGRVRWSAKLRQDHRLMAAIETLMKRATGTSTVPVQHARMGLPVVSVVAGAGTNQYVLGDLALQAREYAATLHLARKYDLPLPTILLEPSPTADEDQG